MHPTNIHAGINIYSSIFQCSGIGIASLPPAIREDLKLQLQITLQSIVRSFALYSRCILTCLQEKQIAVSDLSAYLLSLPALTSECTEDNLMLLTQKKAKFEQARELGQVFMVLNSECCTFLNFDILQDVVKGFKLTLDEESSRYPEMLKEYVDRHNIEEIVEVKPILNELTDDTKKLILLLDIKSTCKLSSLTDTRRAVACIMGLKKSALLIHDINLHCVMVTFFLSTSVAEFIFVNETILSIEQEEDFRRLSVQRLECNGLTFDFTKPPREHCSYTDLPAEVNISSECVIITWCMWHIITANR